MPSYFTEHARQLAEAAADNAELLDDMARDMAGVPVDGEDLEAWRANAKRAIDFLLHRDEVLCDRDNVRVTIELDARCDVTRFYLWTVVDGGRWALDYHSFVGSSLVWRPCPPGAELPVAETLDYAQPRGEFLLKALTDLLDKVPPLTYQRVHPNPED